ncbi:MAG: NAD(P)/FAD-dependent oxidoreductase [Coriobacteriales bacterium]|nr:NAD(P)/FAD-dependent oxidoreductase [Coriobacteriales bacterium]
MVRTLSHPGSSYDTLVAGAGPAGITCALEAASNGSRVLIVDSSSLPRDKSCGGMLNEYSQSFLAPFGEMPPELVLEPTYVHFRYHDWDRSIRKPTELRFLNVSRPGFDDWLLRSLPDNVDVVSSAPVVGFEQDDREVRVRLKLADGEREVTCSTLVGADGARSAVRRQLGIGGVSTYVTLQDYCRIDGEIEPFFDCIYIRDIGDSFGYGYVVPKGDVAIVGAVFYPKTRRPHERQERFLEILRDRLPLGQSTKREASVALYLRSPQDVVPGQGRVLLAGEAGGFISPTSGEGISYAMNSGRLAGRAIAAAHNGTTPLSLFSEATADIRANIVRKLRWLPFMESDWGKYLAGFVPSFVVSRITKGL